MSTIKDSILRFSAYGKSKNGGGINRVFGSEAYTKAAKALKQYMLDCHMDSWIDSVGNVHGIYRSRKNSGKEIIIGSHLDTVKEGGMFDGLLGIAAGIECVKQIQAERQELNYDIHVIATNGEEGNSLGGTFGSRCLVGRIDLSAPGFLRQAEKFQLSKEDIEHARMNFSKVKCYLELHIEQGCHLYNQQKEIGIVTGIVGLQRYEIEIIGMSNHAGTTRMEYRKDALVQAAKIITYGDRLAREYPDHFVATFETMELYPNALAVINGQVKMVLEFRNQKEEMMERYIDDIIKYCKELMGENYRAKPIVKKSPVKADEGIIASVEQVCRQKGINYCKMPSGATHDGNMFAQEVPIGVIFVPSKDGISHSSQEWTDWVQCEKGAEVLYATVLNIDREAGIENTDYKSE